MMDDFAGAITDLTAAIELYSRTAETSRARRRADSNRDGVAAGIAEADRTRDLDTQCGLAYFDRGLAYAVTQNTTLSERDIEAAIKLFPKLAERARW